METKSDPVLSVDHRIASTGYVISLEVPDFRIDDIRAQVRDGVLCVAGQLSHPSHLQFERTFRVPADFSQTPTLSMTAGILTVELANEGGGGSPGTGRKTPTKNYEPPRLVRKQSRSSAERAARTGVDT